MTSDAQKLRPLRTSLFVLIAYGYAGIAALFLLLWAASGERLWPLIPLITLAHLLLLPSLPVLAGALLARRWPLAGLTGVSVLAFIWLFGGLLLPPVSPGRVCAAEVEAPCRRLRVLTHNVGHDLAHLDQLLILLREQHPDIVVLQEVGQPYSRSLRTNLADLYPYQAHHPLGVPGMSILSRYPITTEALGAAEMGYYQVATLDVDGEPLRVINTHPERPTIDESRYIVRSGPTIRHVAGLAADGQPTILAGDLNLTDKTSGHTMLEAAGLTDAFEQAGWGFGLTYPASQYLPRVGSLPVSLLPIIRIDYVWYSDAFTAEMARPVGSTGSDHRAVIADLRW
ncbi:MAG: endonuclease/exonuclease/phosphatase family protein [Anaerolineae bacterium]|nr:endonuclease/exonuclease/phosphatase family protein [Anaerolineae bacterium]